MWVDLPILFYEKTADEMELAERLGLSDEKSFITYPSGVNLNKIGLYTNMEIDATFDGEKSLKEITLIYIDGQEFQVNMTREGFESVLFGGEQIQQKWVEFMETVENEETD